MSLSLDPQERNEEDAQKRNTSRKPKHRGVRRSRIMGVVPRRWRTALHRVENRRCDAVADRRTEPGQGLEKGSGDGLAICWHRGQNVHLQKLSTNVRVDSC